MEKNNQEIEEWRSIEGYEGLYQVSSLGRVKSLDRVVSNGRGVRLVKSRVLRPGKNGGGYLLVVLHKDNKKTTFNIHRLVYEAFNGKIPEGMQVNHIDEDKTNNSIENLNVMTSKENINWGTGNERRAKSMINHKSLSKPIIQYSLSCEKLAEFDSIASAERQLVICNQNISKCCRGQRKTAGGFIFKYKTA